jgi:flagellar assembly protein FliH
MNMSSSTQLESLFSLPITMMEYRDMAEHLISDGVRSAKGGGGRHAAENPEEELANQIQRAALEATRQTEERLRQEGETKLTAAHASITSAVAAFGAQRAEYFGRVEAEVVQLALAIAAKIIHREAQVDPMLVAALVKISIEKMREGSSVTVRVGTGLGKRWQDYFAQQPCAAQIEVVEDAALSDQDCFLETELGVANFGLDTQLKEVERGFFDLLALRPVSR